MIPANGKIAKDLEKAWNRSIRKHWQEAKQIIPVYLEGNVYNMYFKVKSIEEVATVDKTASSNQPSR